MALGVNRHGDSDRALAMFASALKIGSKRSIAVAQLLEAAHRALAVGETQLDGVRLDGLRVSNEDVEVRYQNGGRFVLVELVVLSDGIHCKVRIRMSNEHTAKMQSAVLAMSYHNKCRTA